MPSLQSVLRNADRRWGIWKSDVCWLSQSLQETSWRIWQSLVILIVIIVQAIYKGQGNVKIPSPGNKLL